MHIIGGIYLHNFNSLLVIILNHSDVFNNCKHMTEIINLKIIYKWPTCLENRVVGNVCEYDSSDVHDNDGVGYDDHNELIAVPPISTNTMNS